MQIFHRCKYLPTQNGENYPLESSPEFSESKFVSSSEAFLASYHADVFIITVLVGAFHKTSFHYILVRGTWLKGQLSSGKWLVVYHGAGPWLKCKFSNSFFCLRINVAGSL